MIIPGVIQAYFIFPVSLDNSRLSGKVMDNFIFPVSLHNSRLSGKVMDIWTIQDGLDISSKTSNFQDIPDHVCCLVLLLLLQLHTDTQTQLILEPFSPA